MGQHTPSICFSSPSCSVQLLSTQSSVPHLTSCPIKPTPPEEQGLLIVTQGGGSQPRSYTTTYQISLFLEDPGYASVYTTSGWVPPTQQVLST